MKKILLLFFTLCLFANSFAQVSGYMGKRAVVSYSNYFMFAIKGPGPVNSTYSDENSPALNNTHCLNFQYAYKQRKMICLSGEYLRTGIAYDRGKGQGFFDILAAGSGYEYVYPNSSKYAGDFSKSALLTSTNISIGLKSFIRGYIAPVGRYNKLECVVMFQNVKYDYENFKKQNQSTYPYLDTIAQLGTGEYSYKNIAFAYTIGYQRVLKDRITLDYGIRFAYTPAFNIITVLSEDTFVNNIDDYYGRQSRIRTFRHQLINFHLGIGFLAF